MDPLYWIDYAIFSIDLIEWNLFATKIAAHCQWCRTLSVNSTIQKPNDSPLKWERVEQSATLVTMMIVMEALHKCDREPKFLSHNI